MHHNTFRIKLSAIVCVAIFSFSVAYALEGSKNNKAKEAPQYVHGEIIVKLKTSKSSAGISKLNQKYGVTSTTPIFKNSPTAKNLSGQLKTKLRLLDIQRIQAVRVAKKGSSKYNTYVSAIDKEKKNLQNRIKAAEVFEKHLAQRKSRAVQPAPANTLNNVYLLRAKKNVNVAAMVQDYSRDSGIEYAQPNYL